MKKMFILLGAIFSFCIFITVFSINIYADEMENSDVEVVEKTGYVVDDFNDGGDILFDITEGKVGDTVTALVKANFLYSVESVYINGSQVEISNDGKYQFVLQEGENKFSAKFRVDNEKMQEIVSIINSVKENGFESLFTVQNLIYFIYLILSTLLSSGFFITLIKNNRLKSKTIEQVQEEVSNIIKNENSKAVIDFCEKALVPYLDKNNLKIDNVEESMRVLCRCFVLAQDATPENKLAIINELTKLSNNDEALTNQIKAIIKEEQKAQEQAIVDRDNALKALKENNDKLTQNNNGEDYGQL